MYPITTLSKAILNSSIAATLIFTSASALAEASTEAERTYIDPATGELKVATKLLSEMNEKEKASLTEDQKQTLEMLQKRIELNNKTPNN